MYAASSGVARGITPGSLKLVRNRADITKMNSKPPTTGIAGVIFSAKNGQLENIFSINILQTEPRFEIKFSQNKRNFDM